MVSFGVGEDDLDQEGGARGVTCVSTGELETVTRKKWARGLMSPISYSNRRGHLYVLGNRGEIHVLDVKKEARSIPKSNKSCFDVSLEENGSKLVPEENLPDGFVATKVEVSPVSNPYEQRLAIGGISRSDLGKGTSTSLFVASVNPLQARQQAGKNGSSRGGGGGSSSQKQKGSSSSSNKKQYSLTKVHDSAEDSEHLTVLKYAWHPRSANHLVVLLENPLTHASYLHIYNVSGENIQSDECDMAAGPEQRYALFASGHGLGYGMVKIKKEHRFVDFAFGPLSGWDCFTVFLLAQGGKTYCLCPIIPFGASYDFEVVMQLLKGVKTEIQLEKETLQDYVGGRSMEEESLDELYLLKSWIEKVFPVLLQDGYVSREVEPNKEALLSMTASLCGPVQPAQILQVDEKDQNQQRHSSQATATAITSLSAGSNCTILLTSYADGTVDSHVVMGEMSPQWDLRQTEIISGNGKGGQISVALNATRSTSIQTLLVDRMNFGEGESSKIFHIEVDPIEPQYVYCFHSNGIFLICLSWIPSLSQWLNSLVDGNEEDEGFSDGGSKGIELRMAAPVTKKLYWTENELIFGALISNRVSGSTIAFGEISIKKGEEGYSSSSSACKVRLLKLPEDLPQYDMSPSRPSVSFDLQNLECSSAELDEWYKKYLKDVDEDPIKGPAAGSLSDTQLSEYLHSSISALKEKFIHRSLDSYEDLNSRLEVMKKEAESQEATSTSINTSVDRLNERMEQNQTRLSEIKAKQAQLSDKCQNIAERMEKKSTQLSGEEQDFIDFIDFQKNACAAIEQKIGQINSRIEKITRRGFLKTRTSTINTYLSQLPKVKTILQEDAQIVNQNLTKLKEIEQKLNSLVTL